MSDGEETVAIIGADGAFSENWRDSLPEDIRGEKCLETFGDLSGMAKTLVHAEKQIGKKGVILPTENSTDEEWGGFYNQLGRPEEVTGYGLGRPEDFPEEHFSEEGMNQFAELAHKIGLNTQQTKALFDYDIARVKGALEGAGVETENAKAEATEQLKIDWGAAYDEKMHLANRAINDFTDEQERDQLLELVGNNPLFAKFISKVGSKLVEGKAISPTDNIPTPIEALAEIDELTATPGYLDGTLANTNPAVFAKLQRDITALNNKAYPEQKIA